LPYYNVLKQGYSSVGYKHTMATRNLLSELAKNKTHSEETKYLIAKALTGENNPLFGKTHTEETKLKMRVRKSTSPVYIYNSLRQLLLVYPSVKTLADVIATNSATVVRFITKGALFRGGWYFYRIPYNISDIPVFADINGYFQKLRI
jgi:group I intron endonuclease